MCGICGFTGSPKREVLQRMAGAIYHRGPDDDGFYSDGVVNLAMRRLSIVDVNSGQQPIHNEGLDRLPKQCRHALSGGPE